MPCRCTNWKKTSCSFGHSPVCQNYKSETGCKFGRTCFFRHVEAEEKPSKKSEKRWCKGSVALLKESTQLGCVSQDSYPRKSLLREQGKFGSKHAVKFSTGKPQGIIQKCLMSAVFARQNSEKDHMRRPCTKNSPSAE